MSFDRHLPDMLGSGQVFQEVNAEVGHFDVGALGAGLVRQQELAAVAGRHDARSPVDNGTEVVVAAKVGNTDMDGHSGLDDDWHGPRLVCEQALDFCCGRNGVGDTRKHRSEPIAAS